MSRGRIAAHTESHAQLDIYARDAEGEKALTGLYVDPTVQISTSLPDKARRRGRVLLW